METVASAIKDDLSRVKDVLDIYVRTGMNNAAELVPQLELLKKISDTLGVYSDSASCVATSMAK